MTTLTLNRTCDDFNLSFVTLNSGYSDWKNSQNVCPNNMYTTADAESGLKATIKKFFHLFHA